jgi:flagellar basal body-associated protein FliL
MLKILLIIICVLVTLFTLSIIIYFFNLDMKLMVKIGPILNKHYDKINRDKRL